MMLKRQKARARNQEPRQGRRRKQSAFLNLNIILKKLLRDSGFFDSWLLIS